jgi:hypothetical protein
MLSHQQIRGLVASGPRFQDKIVLGWGVDRLVKSSISKEHGWKLAASRFRKEATELFAISSQLQRSSVQEQFPEAVAAAHA